MIDGAVALVGIAGEVLELIDRIVEADDGCLRIGAHDGLREKDAGLSHLRQECSDAGARLYKDHERERIATHVKVRDFLTYAIVGDVKILDVESVDHLTLGITNGDGRVDEGYADADFRLPRRLLDGSARLRRNRSGRRLGGQRTCRSGV